jgi:type VI secretion system protein ImpC
MAKQAETAAAPAEKVGLEDSPLADLLTGSFKSGQLKGESSVVPAVQSLIDAALAKAVTVSDDTVKTIQDYKAFLDEELTRQLNLVMHHPDFQALESTWRGLHTLVMKSELNDQLKVRVLNIKKNELGKTFDQFGGARWDKSPLYKKIYQAEFGMPGGEPYGCLIGDYFFDHSPTDVKILQGIGQIAAAAHAPFITGAGPSLMKMDDWTELPNRSDVSKLFTLPEYAPWRTLRESEDAKYIGIAFPRFMTRLPYGAKNPSDGFTFEETADKHNQYNWSNAAYAMGLNVSSAFTKYGWCCSIRGVDSGGRVEGLPCDVFETDDGGQDIKCPTEAAITMSLEQELAKNGFMPLSHFKNTDYAAFIGAQSLHKPKQYNQADATANAALAARLPYMFATCRFAHFLKKMVYRKVGAAMEREDVEKWLNNWIVDYVHPNPRNATQEERSQRPLAEARVEVTEIEEDPGAYRAKFHLRPHFQLESIDVSLSLVSKMPKSKQ